MDTPPPPEQDNSEAHDNNSQSPQPVDAEDEVIESVAQQEDQSPAEESCVAAIDGASPPLEQANSEAHDNNSQSP